LNIQPEIISARGAGVTARAVPRRLAGSAPWMGWLVAAMTAIVVLYAVDILFHPATPAVSEAFQKFGSCALFFGAAILCLMKARVSRDERWAWCLFAVAMTLLGVASVYYAVVLWNLETVPYPSIYDGLWLSFYLPAYAALYLLMRKRALSFGRSVWLDALIGGLGVGGAGAAFVFGVILDNTTGTALATATNLAYPIGDLGLLAMVVGAITITGWKASGAWRWIAPAFALFAVTDSIFLVQAANGTYSLGGILDLGWAVAALLIGFAAWRPEVRARYGVRTATMIVIPGICGFAALVLLVVDHFIGLNPLALWLATASILVMLVRLYLAVHDNARMLRHSRVEASTDALTGLGNRRRLSTDLDAHLDGLDPAQPLMLTIFDLDGFKQYNDRFGHPVGDLLLQRLGARLSEVVAGHGTAYRIGGDEFCTLWHESDIGQASITALEAVEALSERGEAFSIGCSYGSVLLPNEAADRADALRIADQRMYSRKGRGRLSAGRQSADVLLQAVAERDSELGFHVGEVAELACATAVRLGLTEEDVEATRHTALLHDVGKVAIPDEIMRKVAPLDEADLAFIRRHTIVGERIIHAAPALARIAKLVRSTHERCDGAGYPDGLAGESIPLVSRIVSVCDAYDAMTHNRTYRAARSRAEAVVELREHSATQFDAQVVEAFVSSLEASLPAPAVLEAA
jgi:two-component system, cell cycle response regulator